MAEHTPLPWQVAPGVYDTNPETASEFPHGPEIVSAGGGSIASCNLYAESDAAFIVKCVNSHAALVTALDLQEAAELANANCEECDGEEVPELCSMCFPLYDDARIARRAALSSLKGNQP